MALKRFDSLFARLLMVQLLVPVVLLFLFGGIVYIERNVAVARLVAERWAPALRQAAGWRGVIEEAPPQVLRSDTRPARAMPSPQVAPRMAALNDELRHLGVPFEEALIAQGDQRPVLWLKVNTPQGTPVWLGLSDPALLPNVSRRMVLSLSIALLFLVGVSWWFTRRLTRPLEQLRSRIQAHQPGESAAAQAPIHQASPEIAAIDAAYRDLVHRLDIHERERALLLAGVSHDLRSPLARIRMAAGLLPDDPATATRRDAIVRNTQVADRLIESFLDHVRAGEMALDQDADLAALARSVADATTRPESELRVDAPSALRVRHTHPLLVERLIANLVDNAFKHGQPPVVLSVQAEGPHAVLTVSDAGAGVPDDQRAALLQAFARGDSARSTPGTGLGLAIVARVVARMGGTLSFERQNGRHAVRVTLSRGD